MRAVGTFEVQLALQPPAESIASANIARRTIDKRFSGDLNGHSLGEMIAAMGEVQGSAGYVAMERVTGTLADRNGSFVLQHSGSMDRGKPTLSVNVVPDSGTDALAGLTGTMTIEIVNGEHRYAFDYRLPPT